MSIGSFSENRASSGMFNIQVSSEDLKAFAALATLVPKAAVNAQRRAINKTLGWLSTHRPGRGQAGANRGQGGAAAFAQLSDRRRRDARQTLVWHQPAGSQS